MVDFPSFSTDANLLLTAAIAFAAIMQWLVSHRLLNLQRAVEDQRTKAWLFLRLKPDFLMGRNAPVLRISNLSQVGVWIQKAVVHLEVPARNEETIEIETVLPPNDTHNLDLRVLVQRLVEPKGNEVSAVVWAEVWFWANGSWRNEKTARYSMIVDNTHVSKTMPVAE